MFAWLRLSRRDESWKSAEILLLRHQLTVLQRQVPARPKTTWADRALLAALLELIPRGRRAGLRLLITPETVLRWRRDILRRRWAREIPAQAAGPTSHPPQHHQAGCSAGSVRAGVTGVSTVSLPASASAWPPRRCWLSWAQFLHAQADAILATDFFSVDLLDGTTAYVLAVIEHATRRIRILGVTAHPSNAWATQMGRNLLTDLDQHAESIKIQLRDRDTKFTAAWDAVFTAAGTRILRSPIQAPRANAITERWIGSCRRELLDQTLIWNRRHLLKVLREYEAHHNEHRPHRALNQAAPLKAVPTPVTDLDAIRVRRHDRIGGVIHEYTLAA